MGTNRIYDTILVWLLRRCQKPDVAPNTNRDEEATGILSEEYQFEPSPFEPEEKGIKLGTALSAIVNPITRVTDTPSSYTYTERRDTLF